MEPIKQNRFLSKPAWIAIAAVIYFVVKEWIGFEIPGWANFVALICAAAASVGIFNNPTIKNKF